MKVWIWISVGWSGHQDTVHLSSDLKLGSELGISWDKVRAKWREVRERERVSILLVLGSSFFVFQLWELVQVLDSFVDMEKFRGNLGRGKINRTYCMFLILFCRLIVRSHISYIWISKTIYFFHIRGLKLEFPERLSKC